MAQPLSNQELLRFFDSIPHGDAYAKPLRALTDFLASHDPGASLASATLLEAWLIYLYFRGLTAKSAVHYLDILSALYSKAVKELDAPPFDAFSRVKKRLKQALPDIWRCELREESFRSLLGLLKRDLSHADPMDATVRDLVLVTLLSPGKSLADVALTRREDLPATEDDTVLEIMRRHIDPKRKYVFPLDQTKYTPRQFRAHIEDMGRKLFGKHLLPWFGDADTTLRTYWAYAALRSGLSPHRVTASTGPLPSTLPILTLTTQHPNTPTPQHPNTPAPLFLSDPPRWYAMRLRRGVRFDKLRTRLEMAAERLPRPEVYYPYEEISRRIGKRIEYKRKPVIGDIVFFRYRATEIPGLFREIGDVAWCYRIGGEYAAIPAESMRRFQQAVGMFTPDYEVGEGGALTLRENEKVVVLGGMFSGLEGEVMEAMKTEKGVVYRLRLFGESNDIEWRLADPALLRKLP